MTSTLPANFHQKKNLGAQELIKHPTAKIRHGFLRKKGQIAVGKWPQRYVFLLHDSICIYQSESSKSSKCFSLLGYNKIRRFTNKSNEWCFEILPAAKSSSLRPKVFSCVSDDERRQWMTAIKNQMFSANKVTRNESDDLKALKSISIGDDEDEYRELELPVYEATDPDAPTVEGEDHDSSFEGSNGSVKSAKMPKRSRSLTYDDATSSKFVPKEICDEEDDGEVYDECEEDLHQTSHGMKRTQSDSSNNRPPRYSAVCQGDAVQETNEHTYANFKSLQEGDLYVEPTNVYISLEKKCTVTDSTADRDDLIRMLQSKRVPGTYLIRKSRQNDSKVIAYLMPNARVVEYKIKGGPGNYSLDDVTTFPIIDALLEHYTNSAPLPKTDKYLVSGYHIV